MQLGDEMLNTVPSFRVDLWISAALDVFGNGLETDTGDVYSTSRRIKEIQTQIQGMLVRQHSCQL
jgi:hypothetical protein